MSCAQSLLNRPFDFINECRVDCLTVGHFQKQNYGFVRVGFSSSTDAQCVSDTLWEVLKHNVVDFCRSESDASGLQYAITATKHPKPARVWIKSYKISVMPYWLTF